MSPRVVYSIFYIPRFPICRSSALLGKATASGLAASALPSQSYRGETISLSLIHLTLHRQARYLSSPLATRALQRPHRRVSLYARCPPCMYVCIYIYIRTPLHGRAAYSCDDLRALTSPLHASPSLSYSPRRDSPSLSFSCARRVSSSTALTRALPPFFSSLRALSPPPTLTCCSSRRNSRNLTTGLFRFLFTFSGFYFSFRVFDSQLPLFISFTFTLIYILFSFLFFSIYFHFSRRISNFYNFRFSSTFPLPILR